MEAPPIDRGSPFCFRTTSLLLRESVHRPIFVGLLESRRSAVVHLGSENAMQVGSPQACRQLGDHRSQESRTSTFVADVRSDLLSCFTCFDPPSIYTRSAVPKLVISPSIPGYSPLTSLSFRPDGSLTLSRSLIFPLMPFVIRDSYLRLRDNNSTTCRSLGWPFGTLRMFSPYLRGVSYGSSMILTVTLAKTCRSDMRKAGPLKSLTTFPRLRGARKDRVPYPCEIVERFTFSERSHL
ncbi:hypothetical protein IW262DRAFT_348044 [Armillaria fumosa]|nr:hypothetical protein IW262DRAFT_348044 [Armillaria fumosa]